MVHLCKGGVFLAAALVLSCPVTTFSRHVLLDKVLSDNPPPGQSDASCAHLVRIGLDEGRDKAGRYIVEPEVKHLIQAMRMMWWECASEIANTLAKYGSEVEEAFQMEQRYITKSINQIKSALEKGKPRQSISPAFEWAQSSEWVYINAKMSHKLDAPATLNVVSEGVEIGQRSLKFAASKDQKRFALDLKFYADIDPQPSSISFGSVGRVTFTLKKAKNGVKWPTLLEEGQKRPVNMHVWWAKQEEYTDELDDLEEAAAAAAVEANKESGLAAEGKEGTAEREKGSDGLGGEEDESAKAKPPLTEAARLQKAQKEATTSLSKEKKSRLEELEKEKRAMVKSIDAEATAKKKEAEEVLRAKKAMVDDEFEEIIRNRHAEIEAAFVSTQSEL